MTEVISLIAFAALALILILSLVESAAYTTGKLLEPVVGFFQRTFLGIDRIKAGSETLLGQVASLDGECRWSTDDQSFECHVVIDGERWRARIDKPIDEAQAKRIRTVRVTGRDGLSLTVEPVADS